MSEHHDACECAECEAECQRLRQLILDAVANGTITEEAAIAAALGAVAEHRDLSQN